MRRSLGGVGVDLAADPIEDPAYFLRVTRCDRLRQLTDDGHDTGVKGLACLLCHRGRGSGRNDQLLRTGPQIG